MVVVWLLSGTYNNQYMVVDLKKVRLSRELTNGTLWVIEQIPGLVVGADQTTILRAGLFHTPPCVCVFERELRVTCDEHIVAIGLLYCAIGRLHEFTLPLIAVTTVDSCNQSISQSRLFQAKPI